MSLHITPTTKSAKLKPTTRDKLRKIIETELERQGPDVDLNFIDTSMITDMARLFWWIDIGNIKIDKWNTSNVTIMDYMFTNIEKFNADLSSWNVSSVVDMNSMFRGCEKFNCDLSNWDVSNVERHEFVFDCCPISDPYKPKFKAY